ncbi:FecR family protein [Botryobacter ruber]|uniref:FecR family protein n=1 Tax=Botryobacter ruber TaxID=2171629 RepID=UPI000E0C449C|nr:FecR domain-containing protein [Botryobacter ruber]
MPSQSLVTRELLHAYFAGQATPLQKRLIERWMEEEAANEEFFYACLHEWETRFPQYPADVHAGIARFHEKLEQASRLTVEADENQVQDEPVRKSGRWQRWMVAAAVLFLVHVGAWQFREAILYKSFATGSGEISQLLLEDGSQVTLNENSTLRVPRFGFGKYSRNVQLSGEAKFSVVHTPDDKKFVVSTDSVFQVEVLGTVFNVTARDQDTKVVLQEGKVKVLYKEEIKQAATPLIMAPGDLVTVDHGQKQLTLKKVKHPENYSAWQNGQFIFDKTSLGEISEILRDNYGLTVETGAIDTSSVTVSGSFKASNADELLQALSEILNIRVERQDANVILTEK